MNLLSYKINIWSIWMENQEIYCGYAFFEDKHFYGEQGIIFYCFNLYLYYIAY